MKKHIPITPIVSRMDLSIVFITDSHQEGYTAYFLEYPNVVVEGNSKHQAAANLFAAFSDVINSGNLRLNFEE